MPSSPEKTDNFQDKWEQAQQLQAQGQLEEALAAYGSILEVDGQHLATLHQLGKLYETQGKFAAAVDCYQQALEIDPEPPFWVYRHLGFSLSQNGELEGAIGAYNKAIALNPEDVSTYGLLGQIQGKVGDLEGAISNYNKAVEIQPEQPFWLYLNLGDFLTEIEKFDNAISAYQEASRLEPENPGVYRLLGEVQGKHSDLEGAIESYRKAIVLNPKQPAYVYENLGDALFASNRKKEAIEAYRCAVEIQPNLPSVRQKLANLLGQESDSSEEVPINSPESPTMPTETQHAQLYHQATEILEQVPDGLKSSSSSLSIADLELSPDRIEKQVRSLKEKLNTEYNERVVDGLLNELAAVQLSVENIEFQLKVITSHLLMPDRLLPGCSLSGSPGGTRLEIDAEFPLSSESGFYPLEYDRTGVPFRWTGPGAFFYFDVFLERQQKAELELIVMTSILDENVDKIRGFVDNIEVSLSHHRAEGLYSFKGIIPALPNSGSTRISFLIPNPVKASDVYPETGDNRVLGVAFSRLIVKGYDESE